MKTSNNKRWLHEIRRWISRLFRKQRSSQSPTIIEQRSFPTCTLLRLERNTAGSIDTWRIIPRSGAYDLLIALDSFRALRSQINQEAKLRGKKSIASSRRHTLTAEARKLLEWQPNRDRTHLFWVEKVSRVPVNGQIRMKCIGIWAVDLEGILSGSAGYDRFAHTIARCAVVKTCELPEDRFNLFASDSEHWINQLSRCAKAFLGDRHQV